MASLDIKHTSMVNQMQFLKISHAVNFCEVPSTVLVLRALDKFGI